MCSLLIYLFIYLKIVYYCACADRARSLFQLLRFVFLVFIVFLIITFFSFYHTYQSTFWSCALSEHVGRESDFWSFLHFLWVISRSYWDSALTRSDFMAALFTPGISWSHWGRQAGRPEHHRSPLRSGGERTEDAGEDWNSRGNQMGRDSGGWWRRGDRSCVSPLSSWPTWGRWATTTLVRSQGGEPGLQSDVFTETWLHQEIPDDNISISGLQTVRADRDRTENGQCEGGRLVVLFNNCWCDPGQIITIKQRICCPDIELFSVRPRPYYCTESFHASLL